MESSNTETASYNFLKSLRPTSRSPTASREFRGVDLHRIVDALFATRGHLTQLDLIPGCKSELQLGGLTFSNDDILFLDEVAETIIPATKTPGAKEAKVGELMKIMVNR